MTRNVTSCFAPGSKSPLLQWANTPALRLHLAGASASPLQHDGLSREELEGLVVRTAAGLKQLGIGRADPVLLYLPMSYQLVTTILAIQRLGALPVQVSPDSFLPQLAETARVLSPRAMISLQKVFVLSAASPAIARIPVKIGAGPSSRRFTASLEELMAHPGQVAPAGSPPDAPALVTGLAGRFARRTYQSLAIQQTVLNNLAAGAPGERALALLPSATLTLLASGIATVVPAFDPGRCGEPEWRLLADQLRSCEVSTLCLTPAWLDTIARHFPREEILLPGLSRIIVIGQAPGLEVAARARLAFPNADLRVWPRSPEEEAPTRKHLRIACTGEEEMTGAIEPLWSSFPELMLESWSAQGLSGGSLA